MIAASSDDWNSCCLRQDQDGTLYACLVMGEPFFDGWDAENSGDMDSRGGGDIEEWISRDGGNTWEKQRDLTPRHRSLPVGNSTMSSRSRTGT